MALTRIGLNQSINLASNVTGTLPVANGGTAITSGFVNGGVNTPAFHAYKTATQNVTSNTSTKAEFDVEVYDTAGAYDHSSNYRFTPQTAGKYFVYANLHLDGTSYPSYMETSIYKNGSVIAISAHPQAGNYFYGNILVETTVDMNGSSDYVEVYGKVTQSGTTHFGGGEKRKYFGAYKIIE
jgi:hypothetical protein|tara:strand:+ start:458 stop:1003 length:546 start_codon:yes stop_codon:yes gene_type:complete